MAHARQKRSEPAEPVEPAEPTPLRPPRITAAERPPGTPPEQWEARIRHAQLTLVNVLLRARERLIAEGKLNSNDP